MPMSGTASRMWRLPSQQSSRRGQRKHMRHMCVNFRITQDYFGLCGSKENLLFW
jgi:hypothetical protein